ncbi:MAG: DUF1080 domain-containing protein [Gemmatimonadota bacterium]
MNPLIGHHAFPRAGMLALFLLGVAATSCSPAAEEEWISLFSGRDLSGWTVKITGSEVGEDSLGTFRVEDGLLTVGYENYEGFQDRFGHLFYREPFSHYQLRVEYRFVGTQVPGGPGWAFKNSGVMFHAQSPESMLKDQSFPLSLEAQFLGGNGTDERPTANLCTPGTHVDVEGVRVENHCIPAAAPTFHGEEWVTLDLFVLGDSLIVHLMNGDTVLAYSRPVVGGASLDEFGEPAREDGRPLTEGYIALQSESHPIQFRQVLLRRLPGNHR